MLPGVVAVLVTLLSLAEGKQKDFYTFKVVNSRGKLVSLEKYRGSVSLVSSLKQLRTTGDDASKQRLFNNTYHSVCCMNEHLHGNV